MIDIIIPTLGRMNNQVTYNNLPKKYKNKVTFVVQSHEFEQMSSIYGESVLCLPKHIDRIAPTREWIFNKFKDVRHIVFDDDLGFMTKIPNPNEGTKWISNTFDESDFDSAFQLVESWMDDGIVFGGLLPAWMIPDIKQWPVRENQRIMTNVFYDAPNMPKDIEWTRVPAAEDFDVNLQLLTRGFKNRVSSKYMVSCSATNSEGGCASWRTLEVHNEAQLLLASLWPEYIKIREKMVPSGPWKGKIKLATTIQHKKAYMSSQKNDSTSLESFF